MVRNGFRLKKSSEDFTRHVEMYKTGLENFLDGFSKISRVSWTILVPAVKKILFKQQILVIIFKQVKDA